MKTRLDETRALAIIFANTRRKKRSADLVMVARAFDYLVRRLGSQRSVSQRVGLSAEMVREFLSVLKLAPAVQALVEKRKIDRLDVAYRLSKIRDEELQFAVAKEAAELPSRDFRDIERLVSAANLSLSESKQRVAESKLKDLHVFVLDFSREQYDEIRRRAKGAQKEPADVLKRVVVDWLEC